MVVKEMLCLAPPAAVASISWDSDWSMRYLVVVGAESEAGKDQDGGGERSETGGTWQHLYPHNRRLWDWKR